MLTPYWLVVYVKWNKRIETITQPSYEAAERWADALQDNSALYADVHVTGPFYAKVPA